MWIRIWSQKMAKNISNTKYANQNKKISKILIYAVLSRGSFCCEFTHFFGVQFSKASKCVGVQKRTNKRYGTVIS